MSVSHAVDTRRAGRLARQRTALSFPDISQASRFLVWMISDGERPVRSIWEPPRMHRELGEQRWLKAWAKHLVSLVD